MTVPEPPPAEIRLVLCTCPPDEAARIADALVGEGFAACVNSLPEVVSTYRWQGAVEHDRETLLLIKTHADTVPALADRIRQLHPYELPEVIAVPVTAGLSPYIAWVAQQCRPPGAGA